jgi:catechol 2,3-dioxygenase-like lactoylglutathione lyase family enzyme
VGPLRAIGRLVVLADDQDRALRFYRDVLGFEVLHDETVDDLRLLHVGIEGQADVGLWLLRPQTPAEHALVGRQAGEEPLLVLYTDDLEAVLALLRDEEIEFWAVRDDPPDRSVHLEDDVGNVIVIVEQPASDGA